MCGEPHTLETDSAPLRAVSEGVSEKEQKPAPGLGTLLTAGACRVLAWSGAAWAHSTPPSAAAQGSTSASPGDSAS